MVPTVAAAAAIALYTFAVCATLALIAAIAATPIRDAVRSRRMGRTLARLDRERAARLAR